MWVASSWCVGKHAEILLAIHALSFHQSGTSWFKGCISLLAAAAATIWYSMNVSHKISWKPFRKWPCHYQWILTKNNQKFLQFCTWDSYIVNVQVRLWMLSLCVSVAVKGLNSPGRASAASWDFKSVSTFLQCCISLYLIGSEKLVFHFSAKFFAFPVASLHFHVSINSWLNYYKVLIIFKSEK